MAPGDHEMRGGRLNLPSFDSYKAICRKRLERFFVTFFEASQIPIA
jgi:hypothetical protein